MGASRFRWPTRRRPAPLIDLVAVAADDALLDALAVASVAGKDPTVHPSDDALPGLFAAWQERLRAHRLPHPPTVEDARRAVQAAPPRPRSARPAAAVALGICALLIGSTVVGARSARPGDALWPVTEVVWADQAGAVVAAQDVRGALSAAQRALYASRTEDAAAALANASIGLKRVSNRDEHAAMADDLNGLVSQLVSAKPTARSAVGDGGSGPGGGGGSGQGESELPAGGVGGGGSGQGEGGLLAGGAPAAIPADTTTARTTESPAGAGAAPGSTSSAGSHPPAASSLSARIFASSSGTSSSQVSETGSAASSSGTRPPASGTATPPNSPATSSSGPSSSPTSGTPGSTPTSSTTTSSPPATTSPPKSSGTAPPTDTGPGGSSTTLPPTTDPDAATPTTTSQGTGVVPTPTSSAGTAPPDPARSSTGD